MKYYCKVCLTKLIFIDDIWFQDNNACPVCGAEEGPLIIIPDYETPQQYQKRTGRHFPKNGVVFLKEKGNPQWEYREWESTDISDPRIAFVVIADPPILPPDNWEPI